MNQIALDIGKRGADVLTPLVETPFHSRIEALNINNDWYAWSGFKAPNTLSDEELEYFAIRSTAALFDISPMTKYRIEGPDAEAFCNRLTLRDVRKLGVNRVHYTAWCDDHGHVLDDGTLFRLGPQLFRLCSQERHLPWLLDSAEGFDVRISDESTEIAGLALQGPVSWVVLRDAGFEGVEKLRPFQLAEFAHEGGSITISRTGFTGDLGYELFCHRDQAHSLWDRLWESGERNRMRVIGYAALNHARIEAGFIVANADFVTSETALREDRLRLPDEIGLDWMIDVDKPNYNGRRAIMRARENRTLKHILVGLEVEGNVAGPLSLIYHRKKKEAGIVTASAWSPILKKNIAIASLSRPYGERMLDDLWVEIYALRELSYSKMMKRVKIVPRPFLKLDRRGANPPGVN
jgi:aminomethyltransferase